MGSPHHAGHSCAARDRSRAAQSAHSASAQAYATLPETARERAVELIETAAAGGSAFTLYRFAADLPDVDSYVGGSPWCNPGDVPPPDSKHLLIQIRLDEPSLGPAWQGRIVQVFITDDWQTPTRSMPGLNRDGEVGTIPEPLPRVALRPMRMPLPPEPDPNSDEDDGLANPTWLLNNVPGLCALLSPHHRDVQGLLTQILGPGTYGYTVDAPDLIYSGGRPLLIQNPHDATCPVCKKPMRFLLQFGDVIGGIALGDAGARDVYGCDEHPDHCEAFVDSH